MVGAWKNVVASKTSVGTETTGSTNCFFAGDGFEPESSGVCSSNGS